jgi:hypothetical protein
MTVHWAWLLAAFAAGVLLLPAWAIVALIADTLRGYNRFHG